MKNLLNNLLNWVLKKGPSETKKDQAWEEKEQAGSKKDQVKRTKLSEKEQAGSKKEQAEQKGNKLGEKGTSLEMNPCVMGSEVEKMGSEAVSANHALITQLSRNNHPISLRAIRYAAVLFMVLMVGIGNVWGTDCILYANSSGSKPSGTNSSYTGITATFNSFKDATYTIGTNDQGFTNNPHRFGGSGSGKNVAIVISAGYQAVITVYGQAGSTNKYMAVKTSDAAASSSDTYNTKLAATGTVYKLQTETLSAGTYYVKSDGDGVALVQLEATVTPAASGKNIYLKPNGIWNPGSGERFAAYYWKSANTSDNGWVDFASYNSCTPVYKAVIPAGYDKTILCRMDGSKAANNWDNKWNQTLDLTVPTGNDTLYTISSINGCTDGKSCGSWGTYTPPTFTISFQGNGNTGGSTSSHTGIACNGSQELRANGFSRTGWTFTGWNTSAYGDGDAYAAGATISSITSDITLYAQWSKVMYVKSDLSWWYDSDAWFAVWVANEDESKQAWVAMTKAENCSDPAVYKATVPGNGYTKIAFVRKNPASDVLPTWDNKWNHTSKGALPTSNDQFTITGGSGDACTGTWGTYSAPTLTVTYNDNGSTGGSVPTDGSSPYACGSTVTVLGNTGSLVKTGYTFAGWNTAAGGGGDAYAAAETFTISANTTLYAQWEEIKYTVTYNVNGGGSVTPTSATQASSGASVTLPTPTWSGYTFDGWYNAGTKIGNGGASYTPTANITLYAHWTDNISGKVFSFIDNNYGDKFKAFDLSGWVTSGANKKDKTYTNATTGVQLVIDNGTWENKSNAIAALVKLVGSGTNVSDIDVIIPTGKIATVKISYGAYGKGDDYRLTVNSTAQANPDNKLDDGDSNAEVISHMKEITLNNQTGTLQLGISNTSKNNYIGRVSAVITGYTVSYAAGTYGSGSLASGTKTHGSNFTLSSSDDSFTRDGYVYDGWSTNADGSTKDYNLGGTYSTDAAITLYPHWVASCTAPSALAAATPTAKGITLSVTDANNVNNYEFYVSTSSTAPEAGATATHSVSSAKSLAITNLVAGTTYYAWARSVCGVSNKSGWTALGSGGTFTTSTVTVTHTLTNVSKTSGGTTAGGSDYTAVYTADAEYSMPTPTVTIGGNTATSGTDYTWSDGTLTIPANKINGNIVITLNSVPSAPSSAIISGTYHYFPGENISLTCTPSGNNGPTTYQWYKGGKENGNAIEGATSATYTKNSCAFADAGSYYCKVTCNETSIWANTNSYENYDVKILRLYVNGSKSGEAYGNVDFTKVDGTTATASIALGSGWTYGFNIADGCGHYYGNSGTMTENNCTNWTTNVNGTDCGLTTTNAATYIFTINYSSLEAIVTSVTYPVGNQAADKVIYFDNNVLKWTGSSIYYRIGHSSHSQASQLSLVSGTANLYKMTTTEYNGFSGWHIANATGDVGSGKSIYKTVDGTPITEATAHEGGAVTQEAITVTPTTSKGYGEDVGVNDNCEFFNYTITSGMKTQNVAISPYSNGTIAVNYTNTSNVASTLTSGNADLAHTVILTSITAVPDAGYDASAITINGNAYTANYVVTGATTIAASFTPHVYTITYLDKDGSAFSGSHVDSPNAHPTSHTYATATTLNSATKTGYTFGGWYTSSDCSTGLVTSLGATDYTADITLYAKWTAAASLTAISADVLYQAADMANITFTGSDQYWAGLSTNNLFQTYGNGTSNSAKGKTISSTNVTDDISTKSFTSHAFVEGSDVTSGTADPTCGAIEFITPSTAGLLYVYTVDGSDSNLKLRKKGSSTFTALTGSSKYNAIAVDANSNYYIHGNAGKRGLYGIQYVSTYAVSITPTNVTKATGATGAGAAIKGKAYTATFTAPVGYTLPSDVTSLTIGGTPQTKGSGYTWTISDGTATLTVPADKVTGNIVVSVAGVAAVTHDVTFSLTNVAYSSGDNQGTGAATEGVEFSTVFAASSGYSLPGTITVTIGGVEQTAGTGYTWAQGSGTLTIQATYVTDDIVVTIVGEEMEGDGCDELVHTEAATATSLSTSVGTATLYNPSSQSKNSKAIKLNSTGYVELSPKAGKSFAAGDSLIVVVYNQATSAKTTGFKIGSTDYTASIAKQSNYTFRQKLVAANIVSNKVKIERNSSDGWFVSAIIKHCEDLPSCTTPTLPTLSNQTVCPGSDIAAWNAEPTNIATITGASEDVAYSWKKKGSDTEIEDDATLDLGSSATEGMAGTYVVTVTVSKTGYISKSASAEVDLTVTPATEEPSVSANKATVYAGNSVTLTATCGSSGTITWAWYTCNSDGTGESAIGGATSNSYAIASAPAAGTYYYKVKATGDGTNACGTAEYVYTLTVSEASGTCNMMTIFDGSTMSSAPASTSGTESTSGATWTALGTATEMSGTVSMEYSGKTYTKGWKFTGGATTSSSRYIQIVIPTGYTGDLVMNGFIGSTSRSVFVATSPTGTLNTSIAYWSPATTNTLATATTRLSAGTYYVCATNSAFLTELSVNVCGDEVCTDEKPTATATNNTVCSGSTLTITATGYESDPTSIQWQKKNGESWDNISGATSATYSVASAAAADAGTYRVQVTKGCTRNSNEVTITVPSAPVFGDVPSSVTIMQTIALSISTVEASDAASYKWYKSANSTWDESDPEIGTSKNLIKAYADEATGSPSYYVICRATNSCGTTTSTAIAVNVTAYVEEDCATRGNEGEAQFGFDDGGCGQTSYSETACWTTNTRAKYLTYTAPEGKYLKTAKVTVAVSSGAKCGYAYSTDGGTTWTYAELSSLNATLTEKTIDLSGSNVTDFRIGRNLQDGSSKDWGVTSGNFYLSKACFEYTDACTATTVTPSGTGSETHTIGSSFTEPTFTVKHGGTAFDPQPEITYTSSNEDIATVDDDGTVNFQGMAGSVTITAAYAGDATYCASEGHYTITVSCSDDEPKIVAASSVDLSGCNSSVVLNAKKQDGTAFAGGTYQWYRDGEAISGATSASYKAVQAGVYTVERTNSGCTNLSSNSATVTSERVEPEVERLVPFQYYHVDKTYTDYMKMRHLFTVKGSAAYGSTGKNFKMELSKNGAAATDVTTSNAFSVVKSADNTVDTVMIDLNKLNGKYAEDDELVLTCKAVDCESNVSSTYKDEITIHVIDDTPTMALILNGKGSVVGGDFLEDYEPKNLQEQTGSKTWSGEWPMYTDLKTEYNVTPVNGYAPFNKLNYEPFDIIFLTDFPKASKSDAAATILDDMAALCDYRPLFSFKTHMVHKSPSKWAAKGFTTSPTENKGDGRTYLNIVCYAHPMFEEIKTGDEVYTDASDGSQLVYKMLSGAGYEKSKGMQGFEIDAAENFVTIGLTHYNASVATAAGVATWTPDDGDRMLVSSAERQANPEARMILLSLNAGAHSKLTEKGRAVVMKSLEYLIKTSGGLIEPADCSYTFDNAAGDNNWNTAGNWGPRHNAVPGAFTSARIAAPAVVDLAHAVAMEVRIVEGGSITIPAGKGLEVKSTIRHMDGSEISPTEISELTLEASSSSNGTLIFNNNTGDTKATVWAYSKGFISEGVKNYQYIGTPFNELNALYNYYGSWIYSWSYNSKKNRWGWVAVKNGGPMHAWTGYCISQESPTYYETSGAMTATGTVDIAVPAGENMVIGNSWTAPIDINALTTDDLEGLVANIYFFNTGVDKEGTAGAAGSRYAGGTYVTVPVEAARYEGEDDHINSMQGFFVKNTSGSDGVLHLDYDRHVRGTTRGSIIGDALHAPARRAALDSNEPEVLKIKVSGENYDDKLLLLAREDFSTGFDNGWDGDKWDGNESALYIYTTDSEGTENSVSAIPELEGTIIGFRAGEDDAYTLNFEYLNSDEPLYLYDVENNTYTQIMTGMTYRFFTTDNEKHERFIITRSNGQEVPTGVEPVSGSLDRSKAKKLLIEDKMFIIVNGMLYDATGKVVK